MITLSKMAHQFIDDVSGGGRTADSKLDVREVVLKIRQLMNEVMALKFYDKYAEGDKTPISTYISTYTIAITTDSLGRKCIVLPEFHADLPYNRGLHRLWLAADSTMKDIVISHNPGIGGNIKAGKVFGINYAHQEGLNVILRSTSVSGNVIYQPIIAAPDTIGLNDALPIVPEQQAEILRRLMAIYRPIQQDLTPNGNATA